MNYKSLYYGLIITFSFFAFACKKPIVVDPANVTALCEKWEERKCQGDCESGLFGHCYHDPKYQASASKNPSWQCYAVHVGRTCTPCESHFMINFQGSFQPVNCTDFFTAIEKKNIECGKCLTIITDVPDLPQMPKEQ